MAFCAHCGNEISELAEYCPQCGHPNEARLTAVAPTATGVYAGWWRRFGAWLLDAIIIGIVSYPFQREVVTDSGFAFTTNPTQTLLWFLYTWLMIAFVNGQTVGKMALGIRITRPDGSPVDVGRAAARAAMSVVSGFVLALGYLWAAWDREKRTWHDMVADTRAYRAQR